MDYVELHARTAFSFLRGGSYPEEMAEIAAGKNLSAVAVCDRDGVYGSAIFKKSADEQGIRPIVGAEITLEDESVLPVLVKNRRGYQNLCQLLTRAHLRAEKGKPRVCWNELPKFAEGLVALTGDEEGPLARAILQCRNGGVRAGVRGGNMQKFRSQRKALRLITPHPQSLSPLRGEGSQNFGVQKFPAMPQIFYKTSRALLAVRMSLLKFNGAACVVKNG
jgi:DNA polymerase III alpha subunit